MENEAYSVIYQTAYEKGLYEAIKALTGVCERSDDICALLSDDYCLKECKTETGYPNEDCIRKYIEVVNHGS